MWLLASYLIGRPYTLSRFPVIIWGRYEITVTNCMLLATKYLRIILLPFITDARTFATGTIPTVIIAMEMSYLYKLFVANSITINLALSLWPVLCSKGFVIHGTGVIGDIGDISPAERLTASGHSKVWQGSNFKHWQQSDTSDAVAAGKKWKYCVTMCLQPTSDIILTASTYEHSGIVLGIVLF